LWANGRRRVKNTKTKNKTQGQQIVVDVGLNQTKIKKRTNRNLQHGRNEERGASVPCKAHTLWLFGGPVKDVGVYLGRKQSKENYIHEHTRVYVTQRSTKKEEEESSSVKNRY
jgi:hypothetical protein